MLQTKNSIEDQLWFVIEKENEDTDRRMKKRKYHEQKRLDRGLVIVCDREIRSKDTLNTVDKKMDREFVVEKEIRLTQAEQWKTKVPRGKRIDRDLVIISGREIRSNNTK